MPEQFSLEAVIQGAFDEVFASQGGNIGYGSTEPGGMATATLFAGCKYEGVIRNVLIRRYGDNRLSVGASVFELIDPSAVEAGDRFEFWRKADRVFDRFAADRGTLEVMESNSKRLGGTFEVEAFRFCRETCGEYGYVPVDGPCEIPGETIEDAPRITVTGTFTVVGL